VSTVTSFKAGRSTNDPAKNKGFEFTVVIELADDAALATYNEQVQDARLRFIAPYMEDIITTEFRY